MVYFPGAMPSGTVYWKVEAQESEALEPQLPVAAEGHPPSIDLITIHLESLVGARSVVKLTWQEPPL